MAKSKFHSKKITVDGITFDSKKEYRRYCELALLEKAGQIQSLELQKVFELIPAQYENVSREEYIKSKGKKTKGKCIERACKYIADFTYMQDGKFIVEDVKGYKKGKAYDLFVIKRKLMLYVHGIRIKEV